MKNIKIVIFKITDALKLQRMCLFAITGESKEKWPLAGHMQTHILKFTMRRPVVDSVSMFIQKPSI